MTDHLTRETVWQIVGPVDDATLAELVDCGATADDLAAAQAWRAAQDPLAGEAPPLPEGRAAMVIEILDMIAEEDDPLAGPAERTIGAA